MDLKQKIIHKVGPFGRLYLSTTTQTRRANEIILLNDYSKKPHNDRNSYNN